VFRKRRQKKITFFQKKFVNQKTFLFFAKIFQKVFLGFFVGCLIENQCVASRQKRKDKIDFEESGTLIFLIIKTLRFFRKNVEPSKKSTKKVQKIFCIKKSIIFVGSKILRE